MCAGVKSGGSGYGSKLNDVVLDWPVRSSGDVKMVQDA